MGQVWKERRRIYNCFIILFSVVVVVGFSVTTAHQCSHHHHDHVLHDEGDAGLVNKQRQLLPEELAEEEDLKLYGFGMRHSHDHKHEDDLQKKHKHGDAVELSGLGLWLNAMGCSLLVSLASLICLIILPLIFIQGKPSKAVVDSLALFGAGAMLGDAFLHQLPHAFGGEHSHSHDHHDDAYGHVSHSHSLKDLSVGLSVLAGIVLFLLVERLVRYVEDFSGGVDAWSHGYHHHHKHNKKLKDDTDAHENDQGKSHNKNDGSLLEKKSEVLDGFSANAPNGDKQSKKAAVRKRNTGRSDAENKNDLNAANISNDDSKSTSRKEGNSQSNLVFGYLNLFSDGVHNFTDGMALGSAFLLYGSVGGWSRTLFLLAHELPQEIGDFGILVRSGFSVSKALFFNFLSALVALAGTALALTMGQDPGQSSLIEGFTAGGFIYISIAGVLAEMNNSSSTLRSTAVHLVSLLLGMGVALCISLVE